MERREKPGDPFLYTRSKEVESPPITLAAVCLGLSAVYFSQSHQTSPLASPDCGHSPTMALSFCAKVYSYCSHFAREPRSSDNNLQFYHYYIIIIISSAV